MLSAQLDGEDDPGDRALVEEHLAGCAGCRRWLDRAVKEGKVRVEGTGRRKSPFKYWLDGMEEVWKSEPGALDLAPLDPNGAPAPSTCKLGNGLVNIY